ncbi:xanthine dehydrogenase family protein molybdopterin-binding subunit [Dongia deserti]|uniref:xanthine dehydrogenase family protein molybdopterin-binding subunit n=1 Tax=Dongia deserti TaxID=2268030 RepID=UPI000E64726E|nr:xanthine dehydrogenase family protein molybdopterin-binding subunit [Dongia deserti]
MAIIGPVQQKNMGPPHSRIDGRAKVTGAAPYASDFAVGRPAYAYFVTSSIARGRITGFDMAAAGQVPGLLDILTYETMRGAVKKPTFFAGGGYAGTTIRPLDGPEIFHDGQIVAVVLADSYESAREAAYKVKVTCQAEQPAATFGSAGATTEDAADAKGHEDPAVGDIAAGLAAASATVDADYATPTQHHNPIELFTTTCAWTGDKLTVYEPSQIVHGLKHGVAEQLGIPPDHVRIVSPFVGGAFGSKASVTPRTALAAIAARCLGRPVKLVLTREQGFSVATYRAETRHHLRLGADADGKFTALSHEAWEVTSRPDSYLVAGTDTTARLYACPNVFTKVHLVHVDRNTPGFMRSPPEVPYLFPLECAIDEVAEKLGLDPIELRRRNDTMKEPIGGLPYTSRSLMECFDQAAESFGWARRSAAPASMRDGDWLIGWGCASTCYPTALAPATARVILWKDGRVKVETAAHDLGTGAYTALAQVAAERLGVPVGQVTIALGDSDLPPSPVAGGSITTASVSSVIAKACDAIRAKLGVNDSALIDPGIRVAGFERLGVALVQEYAEFAPHGAKPEGIDKLYAGLSTLKGGAMLEDRIQYAFGAEFVEVRIHARTREIRVPRVHGAFAAGRIVNPKTAHSQLMGGLIWGVSSALHEATEMDLGTARYINDNFADYLVPVNADIEDVSVILVPERDTQVNPLGIKGLGELGNVGTNAAVANAVYHATGRRIRELPIRLEKLLA